MKTQSSSTLATTTAMVAMASAFLMACDQKAEPPGGAPKHAPQVAFVTLTPKPLLLKTELPGRVEPTLVADVRPQVSGIVQSRRFKEGSDVKAGDVLYQIDPATYRAGVDSAQAALAKAEANLVTVKLKAARYKELAGIKAVSQQDADDAAASLQQADAEVASARALVESQRINLDYTRVVASIGGRIGRSAVTQGALVNANQPTALATIQQLDPVYIDITQPSAALSALRRSVAAGNLKSGGAKVRLVLEDGTPYPLEGTLKFAEASVNEATGAVTLRAEFPNPHGELMPGMYVSAVVEEGTRENALMVPQQAVARDATGRPQAAVIDSESKLQMRDITTERAIGDQWLVSGGLVAGDRVVVEGGQKAQPGMAVDAKPYVKAAPVKVASTNASSSQR